MSTRTTATQTFTSPDTNPSPAAPPPPHKRLAMSSLNQPKPSTPAKRSRLNIFSLPIELRQSIYEHALAPSPTDPIHNLTPSEIYVSLHLPRHQQLELRSANYWSSRPLQRRLRLLRAHSAIHAEASAVLYARFAFAFPPWHDATFFRTLRAWLAAPVPFRAAIRALHLRRTLRLAPAPGAPLDRRYDRARSTPPGAALRGPVDFEILAGALRGLRRVVVDVRFSGPDVLEADVEWVVQEVLGLARPFRGVVAATVELRDSESAGSKRREIVDEARRRIREDAGWWRIPAGLLIEDGS